MDASVIYQVISGSGTLVSGGRLIAAHHMAKNDPDRALLGHPPIEGAGSSAACIDRYPGDIIVIPARVPHGFQAIPHAITYLSIRIDPHRELPLK